MWVLERHARVSADTCDQSRSDKRAVRGKCSPLPRRSQDHAERQRDTLIVLSSAAASELITHAVHPMAPVSCWWREGL